MSLSKSLTPEERIMRDKGFADEIYALRKRLIEVGRSEANMRYGHIASDLLTVETELRNP